MDLKCIICTSYYTYNSSELPLTTEDSKKELREFFKMDNIPDGNLCQECFVKFFRHKLNNKNSNANSLSPNLNPNNNNISLPSSPSSSFEASASPSLSPLISNSDSFFKAEGAFMESSRNTQQYNICLDYLGTLKAVELHVLLRGIKASKKGSKPKLIERLVRHMFVYTKKTSCPPINISAMSLVEIQQGLQKYGVTVPRNSTRSELIPKFLVYYHLFGIEGSKPMESNINSRLSKIKSQSSNMIPQPDLQTIPIDNSNNNRYLNSTQDFTFSSSSENSLISKVPIVPNSNYQYSNSFNPDYSSTNYEVTPSISPSSSDSIASSISSSGEITPQSNYFEPSLNLLPQNFATQTFLYDNSNNNNNEIPYIYVQSVDNGFDNTHQQQNFQHQQHPQHNIPQQNHQQPIIEISNHQQSPIHSSYNTTNNFKNNFYEENQLLNNFNLQLFPQQYPYTNDFQNNYNNHNINTNNSYINNYYHNTNM